MNRREIITLLGCAATWPLAARAQQMPVIGFLHGGLPEPNAAMVAAFRKGLGETGYVEGHNVTIEFRWAAGHENRLPELATELVRRRVSVIATPLSTQAALAAKTATAEIPIVFGTGGDPVALGLIASFNRPGGNVTGISFMTAGIGGKVVGLVHELLPQATQLAALINPTSSLTDAFVADLRSTAATLDLDVQVVHASSETEIEAIFATLAQSRSEALMIAPDALFTSRRAQLAALCMRHAMPATHMVREFAEAGGLMSYGPNLANAYRQTGIYVGRILKGERPADLPVMQPMAFELVINLKTARSLGLAVPDKLLAIADEVIE
jgi:putative tryptophan/tyrosine transport system substrate-binding protein